MEVHRLPTGEYSDDLSDPETPSSSASSQNNDPVHTPRQRTLDAHHSLSHHLSPAEAGLLSGIDSESSDYGDDGGGGGGGNDGRGRFGSDNGDTSSQHTRSGLFKVEHVGEYGREEDVTAADVRGGQTSDHGGADAADYYGEDSDFSDDVYGDDNAGSGDVSAEFSALDETMDETMRDADEVAPGDLGIQPIDGLDQLLPLNAGVFAAATSPDGPFAAASGETSPTSPRGAAGVRSQSNSSPQLPGPELSPTHADASAAEGFDDSAYVAVQRLNYYDNSPDVHGAGRGLTVDGAGGGGGGNKSAVGHSAASDGVSGDGDDDATVGPKVRRLSVEGSPEPKDYSRRNSAEANTSSPATTSDGDANVANTASNNSDVPAPMAVLASASAPAAVSSELAELIASASGMVSDSTLREVLAIQHQALAALLGLGTAIAGAQQVDSAAGAAVAMARHPRQSIPRPTPPSHHDGGGEYGHHVDHHHHHHPSMENVMEFPATADGDDENNINGNNVAEPVARVSPRLRTRTSVRPSQTSHDEHGYQEPGDDGVEEEQLPPTAQPSQQPTTTVTTETAPSIVTTSTATTTTVSSTSATPPPTPPIDHEAAHPAPPFRHQSDPDYHVDYHHHHHPSMYNVVDSLAAPAAAATATAADAPHAPTLAPPPRHQGDPIHHADHHHHHHHSPMIVGDQEQVPPATPAFKIEQKAHLSVGVAKPVQLLKFDFRKVLPSATTPNNGKDGDAAAKRVYGPLPSPLPQPTQHIDHAVLPLLQFGRVDVPSLPAGSGTKFSTSANNGTTPANNITTNNTNHHHLHHHREQHPASLQPTTISSKYSTSHPNQQYQHQQQQDKYRFLPLASLFPPQSKSKKPAFTLLRLCDPAPPGKGGTPADDDGSGAAAAAVEAAAGDHLNGTRIFPGPSRLNTSRRKMQRTVDTNLVLTSDDNDDDDDDDNQSDLDSTRQTVVDEDGAPALLHGSPSPCRHRGSIRSEKIKVEKTTKPRVVDRATSPIATLVPFNAVERLEAERELELMHALDDLDAQVESALLRRRRSVTPSNRYDASEGASIVNRAAEHRSVINKVLAEAQSYREAGLSAGPTATPPTAPRGLHSAQANAILAAAEAPPASLFKKSNVTHTEARAAAGPGPELSRLRDEWSRVEQLRHAQAPIAIQQQIDAMVPSSKQPGHHDWRASVAPPAQEAVPIPYTNRSLDGAGFIVAPGSVERGSAARAGRRSQSPTRVSMPRQQQTEQQFPMFAQSTSPSQSHHYKGQHEQQQQQHYGHHQSSPGTLSAAESSPRDSSPAASFSGVRRQHSGRHPLSQSVSSAGSFAGDFINVQDFELDPRDSVFMSDSSDYSDEDSGRGGHGANSGILDGSGGDGGGGGGQTQSPVGTRLGSNSLYTIDDGSPQVSDDDAANAAASFEGLQREVDAVYPADPHQFIAHGAESRGSFGGTGAGMDTGTSLLSADPVLESIRMQLGAASAQLQSAEDADAALEAEMRDLSGLTSVANESYGGGGDGGGGGGGGGGDQTMAFEGLSYLGDVSVLRT